MNYAEIKEIVSEPFFVNWFLINIGFLLAGILLGKMFFTTGKSKKAYQAALDKAREDYEEEKKGFSNEVSSQLAELRDGILNSAQAYQKAIEVIGGHIGSTDSFNNLLIEQTSHEKTLEGNDTAKESIAKEVDSVIEKEISEGVIEEEIPAHEIIANSIDEQASQASA